MACQFCCAPETASPWWWTNKTFSCRKFPIYSKLPCCENIAVQCGSYEYNGHRISFACAHSAVKPSLEYLKQYNRSARVYTCVNVCMRPVWCFLLLLWIYMCGVCDERPVKDHMESLTMIGVKFCIIEQLLHLKKIKYL